MTVITKAAPAVMNYDPNFTLWPNGKQTVRLTFGQWQYRGTFDVTVEGNISGLSVIESAIERLYESLPYDKDPFGNGVYARIMLGELINDDEDQREEEWLSDMLISAEIIHIEPEAEQ